MPAPSSDAFHRSPDSRSLNHVYVPLPFLSSSHPYLVAYRTHMCSNLMVDSFIANARVEEYVIPPPPLYFAY